MFANVLLVLLVGQPAVASDQPAPEWPDGSERQVVVQVGERAVVELRAFDPMGGAVSYDVEELPPAAHLVREPGRRARAEIDWVPEEGDVGVHTIVLKASNGRAESTQSLRVAVEQRWDSYMVPGAAYSAYVPNAFDKWGVLQGVSVRLSILTWIHKDANPGPALGRVYVDFDVLSSSKSNVFTELDLSGGVLLSVERSPTRSYLLPYYGVELGARFAKQLTSTLFQLTPLLGVYVYASPTISIGLSAGYLLPLRGPEFDELRGFRGRLGIDVPFW